jgi:putative transposase
MSVLIPRRTDAEESIYRRADRPAAAGMGDGKPAELSRRHRITETTLFLWKRKYGGLQVSDAKRLKALEEENRQLKRLVADQALNLQVVKDLLGKKW